MHHESSCIESLSVHSRYTKQHSWTYSRVKRVKSKSIIYKTFLSLFCSPSYKMPSGCWNEINLKYDESKTWLHPVAVSLSCLLAVSQDPSARINLQRWLLPGYRSRNSIWSFTPEQRRPTNHYDMFLDKLKTVLVTTCSFAALVAVMTNSTRVTMQKHSTSLF